MDNQKFVKTRHLVSSVNNVVTITEKPSPMQFEVNSSMKIFNAMNKNQNYKFTQKGIRSTLYTLKLSNKKNKFKC